MVKRTPNYLLVAVLTIGIACLSLYVAMKSPGARSDARLDSLPMKIGVWEGEDVELTDAVKQALKADRVLCRQYTNSQTGESLGLLIVYRKYGRRDFVHRPELCYPAAGWEIVQKAYTTVPYAGHNVQARLVIAEKDSAREAITYWFGSGDRSEANFAKQQLRMALDRLQDQRYGWAFIRVNVPEFYGDEAALDLTRSFLKQADKPLMKALTGRIAGNG